MTTLFISKKAATKSLGSVSDFGMSDEDFREIFPSGYLSKLLSGAVATFGVVKLSASYNGPCMQVYNGTAHTDVYFDADGVVDRAVLLSLAAGGTLRVTKWYGQSGSGINALVPTQVSAPIIVDAGVLVEVNGIPAIKAQTSSMQLYVPHAIVAPFTAVMASNQLGSTFPNSSGGNFNGSGGAFFDEFSAASSCSGVYKSDGTATKSQSTARTGGKGVISVTSHDGSKLSRVANGGVVSSVTAPYIKGGANIALGGVRVGSSNANFVLLQAFAVLDRKLGDSNCVDITTALNKQLKYF